MEEYLSPEDSRYLAKRRPLVRAWPIVGGILLCLLGGLLVWMFLRSPMLVNPFSVLARIEAGTLEIPMMNLMAGMLPLVMLICFILAFVLLLVLFTAFSNERRYLKIITQILESGPSQIIR